jgi:hypothetical protein
MTARIPPAAAWAVVGTTAVALVASLAAGRSPWLPAIALVLALALDVKIPVPWGGSVPLGYAIGMALPTSVAVREQVPLLVAALLIALASALARGSGRDALLSTIRYAATLAAAGLAVAFVRAAWPGSRASVGVAVAIVVAIAVDAAVTRRIRVEGAFLELKSALPVYLTIGCGAALIAVATERVGVVMAVMAVLPLFIARFSFLRYARASDTLAQTVQALGLVPELAGLAPLGHSERAAVYADQVAGALGFDRSTRQRIITASRLHRLGAVPLEPSATAGGPTEDPPVVAAQGAAILREVGFTAEVAHLVEVAEAGGRHGRAPTLEAAAVRVAVAFDAVVGDDPALTHHGISILTTAARDPHTRQATAALFQLVAGDPGFVPDAIAAGDRFRNAASGLELEQLVATGGEVLPFTRRRWS